MSNDNKRDKLQTTCNTKIDSELTKEKQHDTQKVINVNGVVEGCVLLNVRNKADTDASIDCTIPNGTIVIVDELESTGEFYKITTNDNITGFCMKQFIRTY